MLRSRRFTLVAATVLIGLSGCGASGPRTSAGTSPATSAPVVIHLAASGGGAAGEAGSSDRMMMPMQDITFVFDGSAPDLGATGRAWTLPGGVQPDVDRIANIARLLGVVGEVRALPADQGGGWMVGADDYTTSTLSVSADGMLSWWYNPAPQPVATQAGVACASPGELSDGGGAVGDGTTTGGDAVPPECSAPVPPLGVPDEAAARDAARQLFTEMGYDPTAYEFEVYADEWSANVTAYLLLDGHRSPVSLSVGFGADAAITWASGSLATPLEAGEYPLVGIEGGVARLNDETGRWNGYWGGPMPMGRMESGTATAVAVDAATSDTLSVGAPAPGQVGEPIAIDQPVCEPGSECEIMPLPEPITVHLEDAALDLTMVWAQDGTIWLLPAYTFAATDQGVYTVVAVDDGFIDLPDPFPTDVLPVETMPVASLPVDSIAVDPLPVTPAPAPPTVGPAVDPAAAAELLVGLTIEAATMVAAEQGWSLRVSTLDGVPQALTMDFSPSRVDVAVAGGTVVGIDTIG
ncbi:MAG: hypothetical protein WCC60_02910 [Ilumatobacteraceae bacterium]